MKMTMQMQKLMPVPSRAPWWAILSKDEGKAKTSTRDKLCGNITNLQRGSPRSETITGLSDDKAAIP